MNCDKYIEWLSAALDGELTAEQRRELDAHLDVCPDCAALYETLSANAQAMRELDCELPQGLHDRIMSSLPPQAAPVKKNNVIRWRRWGSLAACLVLVAAIGTVAGLVGLPMGASKAPRAAEAEAPAMETRIPAGSDSTQERVPTSEFSVRPDNQTSQYSTNGTSPTDPNKEEIPQSTVAPESVPGTEHEPSAAPDPTATDNGFGHGLRPLPTDIPGIGGGQGSGLSGILAPTSRYIRASYGATPAPSAVVISSAGSLEKYLKGFGSNHFDENGDPIPNEAMEQLKEIYTDDYFADRCLVAVIIESGSGSTRYEVLSVSPEAVTVRSIVPDVGTCDMAAWLIIVELDEMLDDGASLETKFVF